MSCRKLISLTLDGQMLEHLPLFSRSESENSQLGPTPAWLIPRINSTTWAQGLHRFHCDWDGSMGSSNARILDVFPGCCGARRRDARSRQFSGKVWSDHGTTLLNLGSVWGWGKCLLAVVCCHLATENVMKWLFLAFCFIATRGRGLLCFAP